MRAEQRDYVQVMRRMVADAGRAPSVYQPGAYWAPHAERMIEVVEQYGIVNFRRIPDKAVAAFNTGNHWQPRDTRAFRLLRALASVPVVSRFANAAINDIETGFIRAKSEGTFKLRAVYYWLKDTSADLLELDDKLIGSPVTFSIDGREWSEAFLLKLLELSLLRKHIDFSAISSVIEIGGSYGLLAEIILSVYPHIQYTLVDIAPVAAFAEYYLGKSFPDSARITVKCAHELPTITDAFDLLINVASFQEMDREQVVAYCGFAAGSAERVYLNNNARSASNNLTTDDYRDLLDMRTEAQWDSPLHPAYRPTLFKRQ